MTEYQYPDYFWLMALLAMLPVLYLFAISQKKKTAARIGDPDLVNRMTSSYSPSRYRLKFLLAMAAGSLIVIALANPRKPGGGAIQRQGIDVMIALDVSKSMLAKDMSPSRLERARQMLLRLTDRLEGNRVGLVLFAGHAYLQMPLTGDLSSARMYLSVASPDNVPTQGTVISEALALCNQSFNSKEKKYKAIILVSDGEDHDAAAVRTARELSSTGVVVHSIGIGSVSGTTLYDEETNTFKKDAEGNAIVSKLNEQSLKEIAEATNGTYRLCGRTDATASDLYNALAKMDQKLIRDEGFTNYRYYFPWLIGLALVLLVAEYFVSERRRQRSLATRTGLMFVLFLLIFGEGYTQKPAQLLKYGNELYRKGEFARAREQYEAALASGDKTGAARFNAGNALYKSGKKQESLRAFQEAGTELTLPSDKSKSLYNQGVVLQGDKKLPECIAAYKEALRLDPANQDARLNLQQALREQQKQQQKQEQQNKDNKQKQDKQKQEQNPNQQQKNKDEQKKQQPKMSREEAENRLKALMQQERNLQDKLRKVNQADRVKPEKDW